VKPGGEARGEAKGEAKGAAKEARRLLQVQGRRKFGASPDSEAALQGVADRERLERMAERIFDATSWADLLNTP